MGRGQDPVERASDDSVDLYDVSTWEPRSILDRVAMFLYRFGLVGFRWGLIVAGLMILLSLFALGGLAAVVQEPIVAAFVALSAVPALLLVAYVWYADVTTGEPLTLLIATFFLAVLFAGFAALVNSSIGNIVRNVVTTFTGSQFLAMGIMFFLIVAPIEEFVKLLAVRLYAYRSDEFDAVIVGAVYGAAAGLGFATIENALFISRSAQQAAVTGIGVTGPGVVAAGGTAVTRAIVGPGHVLYSAIAGYYLGLAKFNSDRAVPIVIKGLLVAALFHATYNTGTMIVPGVIAAFVGPAGNITGTLVYVVGFNMITGYYLYRKLRRYQNTYRSAGAGDEYEGRVQLDEFEPSERSPYRSRGTSRRRGDTDRRRSADSTEGRSSRTDANRDRSRQRDRDRRSGREAPNNRSGDDGRRRQRRSRRNDTSRSSGDSSDRQGRTDRGRGGRDRRDTGERLSNGRDTDERRESSSRRDTGERQNGRSRRRSDHRQDREDSGRRNNEPERREQNAGSWTDEGDSADESSGGSADESSGGSDDESFFDDDDDRSWFDDEDD